jgi:thiamine biosynthesis protein ThiS
MAFFLERVAMLVNGKPFELNETRTLAEVLSLLGYDKVPVAVLLNEEVAPGDKLTQIKINNDDVLEVVSFVGGG